MHTAENTAWETYSKRCIYCTSVLPCSSRDDTCTRRDCCAVMMASHSHKWVLTPEELRLTEGLQYVSAHNCFPGEFSERLNNPALGRLVLPVTWKLEPWVQALLRKWFLKKEWERESMIPVRRAPSSKQLLCLQSCIVLSCRILDRWNYAESLVAGMQLFQPVPNRGHSLCRGGRKVKAGHSP